MPESIIINVYETGCKQHIILFPWKKNTLHHTNFDTRFVYIAHLHKLTLLPSFSEKNKTASIFENNNYLATFYPEKREIVKHW